MIFEFSQRHYFFEFERRAHLNRELNFTSGLLTIYGGLASFNFQFLGFSTKLESHLSQVFILSFILAVTALYYFFQLFGFGYRYIAATDEFYDHYLHLSVHQSNKPRWLNKADRWFAEDLSEKYSKAAAINSEINNRKATLQLHANQFIMGAVGCCLWIAGFGLVTG